MAGREVKGIVITPPMALMIVLAIFSAVGAVYWRLSDKLDVVRETQITRNSSDDVENRWAKAELHRIENQGKINYELYRQSGESYRQIIGFLQGRSGQKLNLPTELPLAPPMQQ